MRSGPSRRRLYEPYNPRVALTVEDLIRTRGLDLNVLAGRAGVSNAIRWVHVSELEDPTPWLKGGELLLTTGIGVGRTPARQRGYVRRLADAGLAGLGFGVGFSFRRVPKPLVDAADAGQIVQHSFVDAQRARQESRARPDFEYAIAAERAPGRDGVPVRARQGGEREPQSGVRRPPGQCRAA